jgi:hypothetical protein
VSKKGRFAAIFHPERPATESEPEPKPERKRKTRPKRQAPARPPRASAKPEASRGKIPVMRWAQTNSLVTVGAKVPADVAQHWAIEAKRQRTSISYIISRALVEAFGTPDGAVLSDEKPE